MTVNQLIRRLLQFSPEIETGDIIPPEMFETLRQRQREADAEFVVELQAQAKAGLETQSEPGTAPEPAE